MNTIMQLRKICNHPFIFPQIEEAFSKPGHGPNECVTLYLCCNESRDVISAVLSYTVSVCSKSASVALELFCQVFTV